MVIDPSGGEKEIKPKDLKEKERIRIEVPKDIQFEKDAGFKNKTIRVRNSFEQFD